MSPGGWKTLCTEDRTFWCCTGRALEEFSKLNDTIYSRDNDGVYVNLFIPADLNWSEREIRLRQQTRFPDEPKTSIEVIQAPSSRWTLNLRIPACRVQAPRSRSTAATRHHREPWWLASGLPC